MLLGLKKSAEFVLDVLFPIECIGCGAEGEWICKKCFTGIKLLSCDFCPVCGKESKHNKVCFSCRNKTYLNGLIAASSYNSRLVKEAVHLFKYRFLTDLSRPLAAILIKQFEDFSDLKNFIAVPVPLHPKRLRWRGFNQAEFIASGFSKHYKLSLVNNSLVRLKNTTPQAEISDKMKRIDNIRNAFGCINKNNVRDKKIILIDDVATTMATLSECARVLRLAGAKEVWGAVAARG